MKNVIILFLLFPVFSQGQIMLNGMVKDKVTPVAYANIILYNLQDEFITGTTTNEGGGFELEVEKGKYKVEVSHINYATTMLEIAIEEEVTLETIILAENSTQLNEVVVSASKPTIRREIDKTVVNIENSLMAQSGNIFETLQSAPGLVIRNDAIAMLGRSNVRVSVDGRMIDLSGEELSNYLKGISASNVKAIEVITNPSAKYEAEGNSGIVNIVTKQIKKDAWSNNFSIRHSQAKYGWQAFNNNFSFQKNKLSLLLTTSVNTGSQHFLQIVEPNYTNNPQRIDSNQKRQMNSIAPRVLLDYKINKSTTIGLQYLGSFSQVRQLDDLKITLFNNDFEANQFLIADDTQYDEDRFHSSYNFYFDKKLDTLGKRVTFNFDVLDYRGNTRTNILSDLHDAESNFLQKEFYNNGDAAQKVANYSGKVDVEHPLAWGKLSYGAKTSFSNTDYRLDNFNTITGVPVFNPLQSNEFNFKENIQSVYINGFKKVNDKIELQMGLRSEYTQTKGISKETDLDAPVFDKDYLKVFPTFYMMYRKNEQHVFSFNYGRRINRPAYSQLNPARSFLSSQSSQQGNPFLLPSFSDNLELTHTFNSNLSTTVSFRHTSDAYSFMFDLNDETQEQNITYKNLFQENHLSIMTSYNLDVVPWWHARALLYYGKGDAKKLNAADNIALMNSAELYTSLNNRLTLNKSKTMIGEINFWYSSPFSANIYSFGKSYSLDIALSFKSLIKGMNLTVGAYDVFNSSSRTITSNINNVEHHFIAYPSSRYMRVALSYSFGNEKISTRERNFGNEEVRRRSN